MNNYRLSDKTMKACFKPNGELVQGEARGGYEFDVLSAVALGAVINEVRPHVLQDDNSIYQLDLEMTDPEGRSILVRLYPLKTERSGRYEIWVDVKSAKDK